MPVRSASNGVVAKSAPLPTPALASRSPSAAFSLANLGREIGRAGGAEAPLAANRAAGSAPRASATLAWVSGVTLPVPAWPTTA